MRQKLVPELIGEDLDRIEFYFTKISNNMRVLLVRLPEIQRDQRPRVFGILQERLSREVGADPEDPDEYRARANETWRKLFC